ncbi:MAG: hypothetical protein ACJ8CR_37945 [Roseiflexaceae bacterium]
MQMRSTIALVTLTVLALLLGGAPPAAHGLPAARIGMLPPPGMYLFVELWNELGGSGNLPAIAIDFPGYSFDPVTGRLEPFFAPLPPLLSSDWGFIGDGMSRAGAAGGGISSGLRPLASLPYTTTIQIGTGAAGVYGEETRMALVVLLAADAAGTLIADIDGERVSLAPGRRWSRTVEADLVTETYNGRYRLTSSVANYGWHARALINGPMRFAWLPVVLR